MLSGQCIIQGSRRAVASSLTSVPHEPLLFLYPGLAKPFTSTRSKVSDIAQQARQSSFLQSTDLTTSEGSTPSTSRPQYVSKASREGHPEEDGTTLATYLGPETELEKDGKSSSRGKRLSEQSVPSKNAIRDSVARAAPQLYIHRVLAIDTRRDKRGQTIRRHRLDMKASEREELGVSDVDWRDVLDTLTTNTPKSSEIWHDDALTIECPLHLVGYMLTSLDDHILEIRGRTGCHIKLTAADPSNPNTRTLLLSGQATAVAKAGGEILRMYPKSTFHGSQNSLASSINTRAPFGRFGSRSHEEAAIRTVFSEMRRRRGNQKDHEKFLRADMIIRPKTWTPQSFQSYMEDLVSMEMPNQMHRLIYERGEHHSKVVTSMLKDIFRSRECRASISAMSLHIALVWLVKNQEILVARQLFVLMHIRGLRMYTETFNIMLRHLAKNEDLVAFRHILNLMLKQGCTPNGQTFRAYMKTLSEFDKKLHVVAAMKKKGLLLDVGLQRDICEELVPFEIQRALQSSWTVAEFTEHMTQRYGEMWLSVDSANKILHAFSTRGLMSYCWEFFQYMADQGMKPDTVSVNTVLTYCRDHHNPEAAIRILSQVPSVARMEFDAATYQILFQMAWKCKLFATSRVIWRYACLHTKSTSKMRTMLNKDLYKGLKRLLRGNTLMSKVFYGNFESQVGLFIAGWSKKLPSYKWVQWYHYHPRKNRRSCRFQVRNSPRNPKSRSNSNRGKRSRRHGSLTNSPPAKSSDSIACKPQSKMEVIFKSASQLEDVHLSQPPESRPISLVLLSHKPDVQQALQPDIISLVEASSTVEATAQTTNSPPIEKKFRLRRKLLQLQRTQAWIKRKQKLIYQSKKLRWDFCMKTLKDKLKDLVDRDLKMFIYKDLACVPFTEALKNALALDRAHRIPVDIDIYDSLEMLISRSTEDMLWVSKTSQKCVPWLVAGEWLENGYQKSLLEREFEYINRFKHSLRRERAQRQEETSGYTDTKREGHEPQLTIEGSTSQTDEP
jgi:pentatricopeptide repeat protein